MGRDPPLGPAPPPRTGKLALRHPVLPGDEAVAAIWGRLSAETALRGRPRPVNDMWIAACCLTYEVPLATLNLKDYEDFADLHCLRILGTR
jgi:predicted nucleic acid-binding protein